jgi:hypothetical protein
MGSYACQLDVQRFATRRQARTTLSHAPLDSINSATLLHALGAVYSGARDARGGANRIVSRRWNTVGRFCTPPETTHYWPLPPFS